MATDIDVIRDKELLDLAKEKSFSAILWMNDKEGLVAALKALDGPGITEMMMQYAEMMALPQILNEPLLRERFKLKAFDGVDLEKFLKSVNALGKVSTEVTMIGVSNNMLLGMSNQFAGLAKNIGK